MECFGRPDARALLSNSLEINKNYEGIFMRVIETADYEMNG
jgi:hypothetical protein